MRFIIQEYIHLLKEDGELDRLITDLLISMGVNPISKPQKGRQFGVDICAIGKDVDGVKKVFLFAVKQGNLSRSNWDSGKNSVRPTLNEIKDTYVNIALNKWQRGLPKKIIVCTNGVINQNVQIDWKNYVDKYSKEEGIEFEFWGLVEITEYLEKHLMTERLFPPELHSLLRKTLSFIDLPDYDLSHFYKLIDEILKNSFKQKKKVQKTIRLLGVCLSIFYKWCQDVDNLKPSIDASERVVLKCWHWLQQNELLDENYIRIEFYNLHLLRLGIGRAFFIKVSDHYFVEHSLHRYSKNNLEYSLSIWEHIGIIASIGLTELTEVDMFYSSESEPTQATQIAFTNSQEMAKALNHLIVLNPPSNYPKYDENCIEIVLALSLFQRLGKYDLAKTWVNKIINGLDTSFAINKFFPLFRVDFEKLVDINNRDEECETQSSMLIPILLEWSVVLDDERLYYLIKEVVKDNFPEVNLQIWFPGDDTEDELCVSDYSKNTGVVKHSMEIYEDYNQYRSEIIEEKEMFNQELNFRIYKNGYRLISHIASRHYRSQPFPNNWRIYVENSNVIVNDTDN